ncbi:hypothetical protein ACWGDE_02220 [Streptomyces sp. NPDC054956]
MNRRTLPVAVAAGATACLLLTACGGGDKPNDKIAGTESSAPPSASPSASPADAAGRPKITLPADFTTSFEGWTTGDATKDAALADLQNQINATNAAITGEEAESPALPFYYKGEGLIGASTWVQSFKNEDWTLTGTVRYFNPKVEMFSDSAAGIGYCSDDGKGFVKERKTGKVLTTPASNNSYITYSARLDKNAQGVWQTTKLVSKRGDKTCTP